MTVRTIDGGQGEMITVDTFFPDDAKGVATLFRTVYGEGYPVKTVYNPEELIEQFHARQNIPVVARKKNGDLVGYTGFYRSTPNPALYEAGQGLVLPEYRRGGISKEIIRYICEVIARGAGIDAIFGEAVCNHTNMQRAWAIPGNTETAIEVDLMPAEAYVKEQSATGRVATLVQGMVYRQMPQQVYVPGPWLNDVRYIYEVVEDPRTVVVSERGLPAGGQTVLSVQVFDSARVARVEVKDIGSDLQQVFRRYGKAWNAGGIVVTQVWVKLTDIFAGAAVGALRELGYFFGGILPRWLGDDAILMQRVVGRPNWEGIHLYSERAKRILAMIRNDWEKVCSSP